MIFMMQRLGKMESERNLSCEFKGYEEGRIKIVMNGRSSPENYANFYNSIIKGMDDEYGKDNYVIEDKVVVD
jgi:hypothetical protein